MINALVHYFRVCENCFDVFRYRQKAKHRTPLNEQAKFFRPWILPPCTTPSECAAIDLIEHAMATRPSLTFSVRLGRERTDFYSARSLSAQPKRRYKIAFLEG